MPLLKPRPRLLNRGAGAWDNAEQLNGVSVWLTARHPDVQSVVSRAQVHAVTDDSNHDYLRVVFLTLQAIEAGVRVGSWPEPTNLAELDCILAAIIDDFIYIQDMPPQTGTKLHAAWGHVFSNQLSQLPLFSRSIVGWRRMAPGGELFGLSEPRWDAIARVLFESARSKLDREAALWWVLQKDTFCREQDLEFLRRSKEDVSVLHLPGGGEQVALFFGIQSRGESVKTSGVLSNQGVVVDAPWISRLFLELYKTVPINGRIFRVTRHRVSQRVRLASAFLELNDDEHRLHRLRHTGPSNDIFYDRRDLEQCRRRTRHATVKSLERYTKTAHIVADLSRLPPAVLRFGEEFLAAPEKFVAAPAPANVKFVAP